MRGPVDVNHTVMFVVAGGLTMLTCLFMATSRAIRASRIPLTGIPAWYKLGKNRRTGRIAMRSEVKYHADDGWRVH